MEELDHSGFDKHQMGLETLDLKIVIGVMKIILTELKKKIFFLEETQHKNTFPILISTQLMFQIFSFLIFFEKKKPEHTTNSSALLNVELYNDNLKLFNQAWDETLFGDLDEHVLENLCERQVTKC